MLKLLTVQLKKVPIKLKYRINVNIIIPTSHTAIAGEIP